MINCARILFIGFLTVQISLVSSSRILAQPASNTTMKWDVIELVSGKEVEGKETLQSEFEGYQYWFSNAKNLAKFNANPSAFGVQLDGGCGRMGSLSGRGSTDLWAVHNKKLYLFASEGCRKGFLASPKSMIERDESDPYKTASDADKKKGREVLDMVIKRFGGESRLDQIKTYATAFFEQVEVGDKLYDHTERFVLDFDNQRAKRVSTWNEQSYISLLDLNGSSFFLENTARSEMYDDAQREFTRQNNHELITILKSRNRNDFNVCFVGENEFQGKTLLTLSVYFDRCWTGLAIDKESLEVRSLVFRKRNNSSSYETATQMLSDYRRVNGFQLPHKSQVLFPSLSDEDQKPERFYKIRVNEGLTIPGELFGN